MTSLRVVMLTAPDAAVADSIASALVEEHFAACVQILPAGKSVYRWEGKTETAAEHVLVVKTVASRVPALYARVRQLHPYQVPEAVALVVDSALPEYAAWVLGETADR